MPSQKPISLRNQARNAFVLLLIAVLFLTSSAFVDPQGQSPDPFAKQLPTTAPGALPPGGPPRSCRFRL